MSKWDICSLICLLISDGEGSGGCATPLRRAASLPPTSPSVDTPPVVIVGSSSNTQVDVTFGFELNEQLLALSIQPSPPLARPPSGQQEEAQPEEAAPLLLDRVEQVEKQVNSTAVGFGVAKPDFAARYRERPELLNPPKSRRSYEIVDFISQGYYQHQLLFLILIFDILFIFTHFTL